MHDDGGGPRGTALDAAQAAVEVLEDAPQFNAGRGSVLTGEGSVEMDAAVMDGSTLEAGAVAVITTVRHPVALARVVMDSTPHVLLAGPGAERLAAKHELERCGADWFVTERQRERWWRDREARREDRNASAPDAPAVPDADDARGGPRGTVGAVVLDDAGRLAAATSTGGVRGQLSGRVGDSPLIGSGTYADARVAVSCTGDGELLIRTAAAATVAALVEAGVPLVEACERVVHERAAAIGGDAGLIAVDAAGNIAMPFNTTVMHRAWRSNEDRITTRVWADEVG
jgi:beta-aspartyl-peptidase (threonine type)